MGSYLIADFPTVNINSIQFELCYALHGKITRNYSILAGGPLSSLHHRWGNGFAFGGHVGVGGGLALALADMQVWEEVGWRRGVAMILGRFRCLIGLVVLLWWRIITLRFRIHRLLIPGLPCHPAARVLRQLDYLPHFTEFLRSFELIHTGVLVCLAVGVTREILILTPPIIRIIIL